MNSPGQKVELIRLLRAYADSGDAPGSICQTMADAADALEQQDGPADTVAVADMEIIGRWMRIDERNNREWWSGGTWLRPGEVVAVLTLPKFNATEGRESTKEKP